MTGATTRNLRWPAFLTIVVAYLAIIKVGGLLIGAGLENDTDSAYPTAEVLLRELIAPIALSLCFGAAVATWLGWWGEILHDGKPVRRWVRFVPAASSRSC